MPIKHRTCFLSTPWFCSQAPQTSLLLTCMWPLISVPVERRSTCLSSPLHVGDLTAARTPPGFFSRPKPTPSLASSSRSSHCPSLSSLTPPLTALPRTHCCAPLSRRPALPARSVSPPGPLVDSVPFLRWGPPGDAQTSQLSSQLFPLLGTQASPAQGPHLFPPPPHPPDQESTSNCVWVPPQRASSSVAGALSSSPVPPAVQRSSGMWDNAIGI